MTITLKPGQIKGKAGRKLVDQLLRQGCSLKVVR
jgi:hypothetical protein